MKNEEEAGVAAKKRVLTLREHLKSKKPKFRRQESWRYKRVTEVWRRPDGVDSKMRKRARGWPRSVEVGYRSPKESRELHPSGYMEVLVRTLDDVERVDPKVQVIRIAHTVGDKKRVEISARAKKRGIYILNPRVAKELKEEREEEEKPE
ncbi:MAG: 50S ribosomal protein L32e [Candidatus Bathyarchaeota archaeon BA1]|nr:MAG: 50S ribosomal protein L32e [Candidatus Bathyarchaeota archaeon BA1]